MSDNQYADILDNDNDEVTQPNVEPESGSALRKARDKAAAEAAELRSELAKYKAKEREAEVKSKLAAAGLPEGAAKFATGAEDLDKWIDENRGLFGVAGATEVQEVETDSPKGEPSLGEEAQAQIQALQGLPRGGSFAPKNEIVAKLDEAVNTATSLDDIVLKVKAAGTGG